MKQYVVDAFTEEVFHGNPAAVIILDHPIEDALMQSIAIENNLSETAFILPEGSAFCLRWFTPGGEVNLCGHATLASAYVLCNFYDKNLEEIHFNTLSGELVVRKEGDLLAMDFPAFKPRPVEITGEMVKAIGQMPVEAYLDDDLVCILDSEEAVLSVVPDQEEVRKLDGLCLHVVAKGSDCDSVTRTFAPKCGVVEDPVCGRAHCHIVPLLAAKTGKGDFVCRQASRRGGTLYCSDRGDRVVIRGRAVLFSTAELRI